MKPMIKSAIGLIVSLAAFWLAIEWIFCRFYVDADHMAVVISKQGEKLPAGKILAGPGEQGVLDQVLGEGRHFLNPYFYEVEYHPVIKISTGKVGVVTSKVGSELPPGEFLAEPGQKGIWRRVLSPGKHRLNPYGYRVDIVDAVSIPIGYVGVITSLAGSKAPEGQFAGDNQKGIRREILQPGLYYLNPKQYKVDVLEIGVNQVSLLGKAGGEVLTKGLIDNNQALAGANIITLGNQRAKREEFNKQQADEAPSVFSNRAAGGLYSSSRKAPMAADKAKMGKSPVMQSDVQQNFILAQFLEFPSRDGFEISLDMTLEFELLPSDIPQLYRDYGDLTVVVSNVIMPQLLSIARLKGSAFRAVDFVVGEGREKFQTDLTEALKLAIKGKNITVHNALIRHVNVPNEILLPIQAASAAKEQNLTNQEKQNTARKQADLNTELSMIDQSRSQVEQETVKLKAEIKAEQERQVATIQGETLKQTALVQQEVAAVNAEKTRTLGAAEAQMISLVEGEKAKGTQLKIAAFGDPSAYTLYEFARNLAPDVKIQIIPTGAGTLWTDLKGAQLGNVGAAELLKSTRPAAPPANR